jgi:hypothetical protein
LPVPVRGQAARRTALDHSYRGISEKAFGEQGMNEELLSDGLFAIAAAIHRVAAALEEENRLALPPPPKPSDIELEESA